MDNQEVSNLLQKLSTNSPHSPIVNTFCDVEVAVEDGFYCLWMEEPDVAVGPNHGSKLSLQGIQGDEGDQSGQDLVGLQAGKQQDVTYSIEQGEIRRTL